MVVGAGRPAFRQQGRRGAEGGRAQPHAKGLGLLLLLLLLLALGLLGHVASWLPWIDEAKPSEAAAAGCCMCVRADL